MLVLSALVLLVIVSGTTDNCIYYSDFPIDCYYQISGDYGEASYGLECNMDGNSTNYAVTISYYDSSDCSGSAYSSYESYCYDFYCNCDGSIDDCSMATWSIKSCYDSIEYDVIMHYQHMVIMQHFNVMVQIA